MDDLVSRARRHAALGDPHRVAIVDELTVSDRSPGELANLLGIAPSLLAHHLDALAGAGLVERRTSAGDRRRRYVRLLRPDEHRSMSVPPTTPTSVLFVCTHNSARSQLAAALWRDLVGPTASSAGTRPTAAVHPGAVAAAARRGLDLRLARPTSLTATVDAEVVITVCDRAHEELESGRSTWHWSIPDPVADGRPAAFDATVDELDRRIEPFVREAS